LEEYELWEQFPQHRRWFNKLYVADILGYACGPSGTAPKHSGKYVIRPCYNLAGMGLGATVQHINAGNRSATPPGYFWCEYFNGDQYSATYKWVKNSWQCVSCWIGYNSEDNLTKFNRWIKTEYIPPVPQCFNALSDVGGINIEFKGFKVIETHLRTSGNPDGSTDTRYSEFIPLWLEDYDDILAQYPDYEFIPDSCDMSDVTPFSSHHRIGFLVK
jgi:hypothetical protein